MGLRQSREFFNEIRGVLKQKEVQDNKCFNFLNKPVVCEKIKEKAGLISVIFPFDFQTFSKVLILCVLDS